MAKTVLVLGATGDSGQLAVLELLRLGNNVILYCRSPKKLHMSILNNENVTIIEGSLSDAEKLSSAFTVQSKPIDAVISLLGPVSNPPPWHVGTTFSDFQKLLLQTMKKHGVKRILSMGTISIYLDEDKFSFTRWLAVLVVKTLVYPAYREIIRISKVYGSTSTEEFAWTVFRLPILLGKKPRDQAEEHVDDGKGGKHTVAYAGMVGDGKSNIKLKRQDLGLWLAVEATREAGEEKWVGQMPLICSVRNKSS